MISVKKIEYIIFALLAFLVGYLILNLNALGVNELIIYDFYKILGLENFSFYYGLDNLPILIPVAFYVVSSFKNNKVSYLLSFVLFLLSKNVIVSFWLIPLILFLDTDYKNSEECFNIRARIFTYIVSCLIFVLNFYTEITLPVWLYLCFAIYTLAGKRNFNIELLFFALIYKIGAIGLAYQTYLHYLLCFYVIALLFVKNKNNLVSKTLLILLTVSGMSLTIISALLFIDMLNKDTKLNNKMIYLIKIVLVLAIIPMFRLEYLSQIMLLSFVANDLLNYSRGAKDVL